MSRILVGRAGRAYVAGPTLGHAQSVCDRLAIHGIRTTVGYWNGWLDTPRAVCDQYIAGLRLIPKLRSNSYLSIKATALEFDIDLIREILKEALRTNATVHFDSMAPATVDRTLDLLAEARRSYPHIGCTLPARWRRSLDDADRAVDLGLRVRVVKGQWSALNGDGMDPQEGFLRLADRLARRRAVHVAVATHNLLIGRETLRTLKAAGIPCELELLHALPQEEMLKIAREYDVPARVYVPFGNPALPYRLKEALRDPRILGWFVRDLIRASTDTNS